MAQAEQPLALQTLVAPHEQHESREQQEAEYGKQALAVVAGGKRENHGKEAHGAQQYEFLAPFFHGLQACGV